MFSTIAMRLKEMMRKMLGSRTIEKTLHIAPCLSSQMEDAIILWDAMYKNQAPWLKEPTYENPERVASLGLPALIASEKARTALIEFKSEITTPTEETEIENPNYVEPEVDAFGNLIPTVQPKTITQDVPVSDTSRAEFLESQYKKLKKNLRRQIEYGIAKGGLVIKPYVIKNEDAESGYEYTIEFDYVQADEFYPLAFDAAGRITEAAFVDKKITKDAVYYKLEYHKWTGTTVQVLNKAFKSTNNANQGGMNGIDLGQEISLAEVPEWANLESETTITGVTKPLFGYFKMPEANTVDTTSPLGVSGFARAKDLIKDADNQYSRLLWEYEAGEMAIDIDRDALNISTDEKGNEHSMLSHKQQRLYRKVDLSSNGDTYAPYAPVLRDVNFIQGLNTILMRIEDITGLSRGTISDASSEARTATELKILKQRSYQSNADIQEAIQDCLEDVIYAMNVYATLYNITPEGEYDVSFEWDDSIITDIDAELGNRLTLQQNGLASKLENRMWYFGETERQAQDALLKIDKENMQSMETEMAMQVGMNNNEE